MTRPGYAHIDLLLDRSGSMMTIRDDMVGGIKAFLADQRKRDGHTTFALRQFDAPALAWNQSTRGVLYAHPGAESDWYQVVTPPTPLADVLDPTMFPRGGTALLDAMGRAIGECGAWLASLPENQRPEKVFFVTVTDGEENSSREWTRPAVLNLVQQQTNVYGWEFAYLGANQDAIAVGASLGATASMDYAPDSAGVQAVYASASAAVTRSMSGGSFTLPTDDTK